MGRSMMVSRFSSRNVGFGLEMNNDDLNKTNEYCKCKKYVEEDAATYLNGSAAKPQHTENPFLCLLEHRQGNNGYWTYHHMILQIEEGMDCMIVLLTKSNDATKCRFDICFKFDHSSAV